MIVRRVVVGCWIALAGLAPGAAAAQGDDWKVEGELGGAVYFGNREQTQFSTRMVVERADELFESSTDFRFSYGVATDSEGVREINRRSWSASTSLDFRPEQRWRPSVSGRMESALERRIALRYNAGAGMRVSWDRDRRNRIDFSLSIQAERTYAREGGRGTPEEVSLARWSSNFRVRRSYFEDRFSIDSNNTYRPVFDSFDNFTLSSRNSFSFNLTEVIALRFSLSAEFDSGAVDRGAETNRDGQFQVTMVASF